MSNKWAVILGASSGFGEATALALAKEGFNIFGAHLDRKGTMPNVERIQGEIRATGRTAVFVNGNAADHDKRKEALDVLAAELGKDQSRVQLLMHSLAFASLGPLAGDGALTPERVEMTLNVMANSLLYWTQDVLARGLFAEGARIFAMTSEGSRRVWPGYGAVSAAKAALETYVRQLAVELAPRKISAIAIRAGVTDTPALRRIPEWETMVARVKAGNPSGRMTLPSDVAHLIAALSRGDTNWVTGAIVDVDGAENIV